MKKLLVNMALVVGLAIVPLSSVQAQDPVSEAIKEGIKKVIKAVDLQVQRWQNETIWLQNAQKVLENKMSELKLNEISDWVEKQRTLYADYFDELWKVKNTIAYYHRIKELTQKQLQIMAEYKRAYGMFKNDKHFKVSEVAFMGKV
jgi:predicted ATPase with chaperone activity